MPTSPPSGDVEWDDFQDLLDDLHLTGDVEAGSRHRSVEEPDGERESPATAAPMETTTPLQAALRRSPDQLDGIPSSRARSRSPRGLYASSAS